MSSSRLQVPEKAKAVFDRGYRFYGLHGGRGSAKSHIFATKGVVRMLERKFRLLCLREVQRSIADSVHQLLCNKINDAGLRSHFEITEQYIRGPNESVALFRGMQNHTAASIKSMEDIDAAWLEEGQTFSQKSLDLLIPTIRTEGSEIWAGWNPEDESDPIEFIRSLKPHDALVIEMNWRDNPWFPEVLRSDMERDRERDPDKYQWIWEGKYKRASEARIFRNYREGDVVPPDNVRWLFGADWGFSVDALAAVRFCIFGNTLFVSDEIYEVGVPMERIPVELAKLPDATKWPMEADSARPEVIDYVKRHGFPRIRPAIKGPGSVEDGIIFLQGLDIVVSPRCPNILNEFNRYAYKTDKQTGEILPLIEDKWNHGIDAIRYGCRYMHRRGRMIMQPSPEPKRGADDYGFGRDEDASGWKVA